MKQASLFPDDDPRMDPPSGVPAAHASPGADPNAVSAEQPPLPHTKAGEATSAAEWLDTLAVWRESGWLRHMDVALARFIARTDPQAPPSLVLASALVAHREGAGHTGLHLDELHRDPASTLGWPDDAVRELQRALGHDGPSDAVSRRAAWDSLAAVAIDPVDEAGASPLVLDGPLLQLRRHWQAERRVAREVLARAAADVENGAERAIQTGKTPDEAANETANETADDATETETAAEPAKRHPRASAGGLGDPSFGDDGTQALLNRLFPPQAPSARRHATDVYEPDWQRKACEVALRSRLTVVTGGPGTGKTYTAARMLVALQALRGDVPPLRVALAAPTGKAAARLRQSISQALQALQAQLRDGLRDDQCDDQRDDQRDDPRSDLGDGVGKSGGGSLDLASWADHLGPGRTLHALLGTQPGTRRFRHDAANPLQVDVLLVDEASMVHLELMAQLLGALPPHARLVLLGDRDQLASVEAGAVMDALCRHAESADRRTATPSPLARQTVVLRRTRRFGGAIGELARHVHAADAPAALALLRDGTSGTASFVPTTSAQAAVAWAAQRYRHYIGHLARRPALAPEPLPPDPPDAPTAFEAWVREVLSAFDAFRVLCVVRDGPWGVDGMNRGIERALAACGLAAQDSEWYEGRPVMVRRNEAAIGLFNGDIGIVLRGPGRDRTLRAWFPDGDSLHAVPVGRLPQVDTAFAMTVHKSQGSEFGHVALVLPEADVPVLTRELVYTGITRSKAQFSLLARDETLLKRAIERPTRRISGLERQLAQVVARAQVDAARSRMDSQSQS